MFRSVWRWLGVLPAQGCTRSCMSPIGAAAPRRERAAQYKRTGISPMRPNACNGGPQEHFHSTTYRKMALPRRLSWALARHTRPNNARGPRPWSISCPQGSINARPHRYLGFTGYSTLAGPYDSSPTMSPGDSAVAGAAGEKPPQPGGGKKDTTAASPGPDPGPGPDSPAPPVVETWHEVVAAVLGATRAAAPGSPAFDAASPGAFQSYWRGVFAALREDVASDGDIPEQLTSPPSRVFWVNVFSRDPSAEPACPCCLPEVEPSVRLESATGVTKGDLVAGLGGFLYGGERPPRVYVEDTGRHDTVLPDVAEAQRPGVLVHDADWMSEGRGGDDGRRYVYTGGWIGRPPMIWVYCCQPEEFEPETAAGPGGRGHG